MRPQGHPRDHTRHTGPHIHLPPLLYVFSPLSLHLPPKPALTHALTHTCIHTHAPHVRTLTRTHNIAPLPIQHEHLHSEMIGYCTGIHVQYFCRRKPWQYHRRKVLVMDFTGLQNMPSGNEQERSLKQFASLM